MPPKLRKTFCLQKNELWRMSKGGKTGGRWGARELVYGRMISIFQIFCSRQRLHPKPKILLHVWTMSKRDCTVIKKESFKNVGKCMYEVQNVTFLSKCVGNSPFRHGMAEWLEFCIQGGYRPAFTSLKNKKNKNEFCEINRDFVFPFTLNIPPALPSLTKPL